MELKLECYIKFLPSFFHGDSSVLKQTKTRIIKMTEEESQLSQLPRISTGWKSNSSNSQMEKYNFQVVFESLCYVFYVP